jgi:hypothetical protein
MEHDTKPPTTWVLVRVEPGLNLHEEVSRNLLEGSQVITDNVKNGIQVLLDMLSDSGFIEDNFFPNERSETIAFLSAVIKR